MLNILWFLSVIQGLPTDSDEYEYSEKIVNITHKDGDRLVGARTAKTKDFPFLVGWNPYGMNNIFSCTGSLITSSYFISAAHCNELINQRKNREKKREECVKATENGQLFTKGKFKRRLKLQCKWLAEKDLEIRTVPKGKAWLGVDNINIDSNKNSEHLVEIKRYIRPAQAYRGGGHYGKYGGYDITLVELEEPLKGYKPACLPGPRFDDIRLDFKNSQLAGYGRYLRSEGNTCETNKYGPMKKHYCDKEFGEGNAACITDVDAKPPPRDQECETFFNHKETPDNTTDLVNEIRIVDQSGKDIAFCYPSINPENSTYGWCKTKGDFYVLRKENQNHEGWGFCSKDCYLDTDTENNGILRHQEGVEILSEELCDQYLNRSLGKEVEVRPLILCVARTEKWEETVWQKTNVGYEQVMNSGTAMRYGSDSYVASAGTCQGDSGGPVFVEEDGKYVVTGVVSGGRGTLGECGGINNPIHYVRVKKLTAWIVRNIGHERLKLCWDKDFEKKKNEYVKKLKKNCKRKCKKMGVKLQNICKKKCKKMQNKLKKN